MWYLAEGDEDLIDTEEEFEKRFTSTSSQHRLLVPPPLLAMSTTPVSPTASANPSPFQQPLPLQMVSSNSDSGFLDEKDQMRTSPSSNPKTPRLKDSSFEEEALFNLELSDDRSGRSTPRKRDDSVSPTNRKPPSQPFQTANSQNTPPITPTQATSQIVAPFSSTGSASTPPLGSSGNKTPVAPPDVSAVSSILRAQNCYTLIPESGKIVVLDTNLAVKSAFHALEENNIKSAPLWDSTIQDYVGIITVTDFIEILLHFYKIPNVNIFEELEKHQVKPWQEIM
eukprot:TRINITY_DN2898_c0_g1_i4.p1 TRINITY_DN2898_c0_g1~~TRINITY_DN2898_c0_g1_i4.p1  ORF type:complete len:283 (+),score=44.52 TRINITY_DN2898_c0_g1_i4:140-988(+)